MPEAPNVNPPASSAAAPWGLRPPSGPHFLMGANNQEREKP